MTKLLKNIGAGILAASAVIWAFPPKALSEPAVKQVRDGQHDFDFNLGTWKTHIRRLQHPRRRIEIAPDRDIRLHH